MGQNLQTQRMGDVSILVRGQSGLIAEKCVGIFFCFPAKFCGLILHSDPEKAPIEPLLLAASLHTNLLTSDNEALIALSLACHLCKANWKGGLISGAISIEHDLSRLVGL